MPPNQGLLRNPFEVLCAIEALKALKRPCEVQFYTDSQYLRNGVTQWLRGWKRNGWKTAGKKPVKNQDLWRSLDAAIQKHQIEWHWVRGHAGQRDNERVDKLARDAIPRG